MNTVKMGEQEIEDRLRRLVAALKNDGAEEEDIGRVMNEVSEQIYYQITPDEP